MRNIILLNLILIIMTSCSSTRNNGYEKFILPENFEGSVIVLYDEKDATAKESKEDGSIVYEIPESGVYYTKREIATGTINHKYYRKLGGYDEEIRRVTFPLLENETVDPDSIYVMDLTPGGFSKTPNSFVGESKDSDFTKYIVFIVGRYKDREELINEKGKKLDSLQVAYKNNLYKE